ncbi:hypothetical protein MKW92_018590 [Papaver armeniacum]|nr:hypothetical protein MKW92_018590 [Papaver armeniacum]
MLGKNLHLCFTKKLKRTTSIDSSSSPITVTDHHHHKHKQDHPSSTTSILFKNFNSLYDLTPDHHHSTTTTTISKSNSSTTDDYFSSSDSDEYHYNNNTEKETISSTTVAPDFSKVLASQRFFFSSPGRTNSIIESSLPDDDHEHHDDESLSPSLSSSSLFDGASLIKGGIPFKTCSSDPYMDFRRSMQEMVESRDLFDVTENWEYLHQLLSCYLTLNPKHTHKFIIGAFADLLVTLMSSASSSCLMKSDRNSDVSDQCDSISRQSV